MGIEKDRQIKEEDNRRFLPKCEICGAPVEGGVKNLCYGCAKIMLEDD